MKKWVAMLPVGASAKFYMCSEEKPTVKDFLENCNIDASLCHQCSRGVESDFEILDEFLNDFDQDWICEG